MPDTEPEKEIADPVAEPEAAGEVSFTSKLVGLLTLVVVFGVLYLLAVVMPKAGDAVGESVEKLIPASEKSSGGETGEAVAPVPTPVVEKVPEPESIQPVASTPTTVEDPETYLKRQVSAAFPNPEEVEVLAVLFSEQKDEFLAMFKRTPQSEQEEIILTRDKFGRYLSAPDSALKMMVLPPKE